MFRKFSTSNSYITIKRRKLCSQQTSVQPSNGDDNAARGDRLAFCSVFSDLVKAQTGTKQEAPDSDEPYDRCTTLLNNSRKRLRNCSARSSCTSANSRRFKHRRRWKSMFTEPLTTGFTTPSWGGLSSRSRAFLQKTLPHCKNIGEGAGKILGPDPVRQPLQHRHGRKFCCGPDL